MTDINSLKKRFEELTNQKSALESEKIQLTTKEQVLQEEIEKLTNQLKEEFDLNSLEEAQSKIQELYTEIDKALSEAESKLSEFEF